MTEQLLGQSCRGEAFDITGGNDGYFTFGPFAPGEHVDSVLIMGRSADTAGAADPVVNFDARIGTGKLTTANFLSQGRPLYRIPAGFIGMPLGVSSFGGAVADLVNYGFNQVVPIQFTFDESFRFLTVFLSNGGSNSFSGGVVLRMGERRDG